MFKADGSFLVHDAQPLPPMASKHQLVFGV